MKRGRKKPHARPASRTAAEARSVSRTKITGNPLASPANRAGKARGAFLETASCCVSLRRLYGHHIPKAPEGNEAPGEAARESRTPRAEEDREARGKRSRSRTDRNSSGARNAGIDRLRGRLRGSEPIR